MIKEIIDMCCAILDTIESKKKYYVKKGPGINQARTKEYLDEIADYTSRPHIKR